METINLTHKEFILMFLIFLKQEHVYKKYVKYIKLQRKNIIKTLKEDKKIEAYTNPFILFSVLVLPNHYKEMINYAFTWSGTEEGHKFWREIDLKWKRKFVDTKINIIKEKL